VAPRLADRCLPLVGKLLGESRAVEGILLPEFYLQLGAMHGTIMVFLAVVPLILAFGNYLVPLMIGAPDMAFPRLNALSYWLYLGGSRHDGRVLHARRRRIVWLDVLSPARRHRDRGPDRLARRDVRARGVVDGRLDQHDRHDRSACARRDDADAPAVLRLGAARHFVPAPAGISALQAAAVLQFMDRVAGTSFFMPSGLVVSGQALQVSGGGSPILWQHLFWFLGHPEVYVLILPALGIVAEVIANITRKPLWGYRAMVGSVLFICFMSFVVWAHHMFLAGMGPTMSAFFRSRR
jgi:cytochrome c oxidase subunit 1